MLAWVMLLLPAFPIPPRHLILCPFSWGWRMGWWGFGNPTLNYLSCIKLGNCWNIRSMKSKTSVLLGFLFLAAPAAVRAQPANLLFNGGFESPVIPVGYQQETPSGWVGGSLNYLFNQPPSDPLTSWPLAEEGNQYATCGNDNATGQAYLSQTFSVESAGAYSLTWYANAGHSGAYTTSPYSVTVSQQGQSLYVDNFNAYTALLSWQQESVRINLPVGTCTLTFTASTTQGFESLNPLFDNVSVSPVFQLPPPTLAIKRTNNQSVVVSWSSVYVNYVLEQNCMLASTNWMLNTNPVVNLLNGTKQVIIAAATNNMFFQLVQQ